MINPLLLAAGRRQSALPAWNEPPPPDPDPEFNYLFNSDFVADPDALDDWLLYDSANGNRTWGQNPQGRVGFYDADHIVQEEDGIHFPFQPWGAPAWSGRDGYTAGFMARDIPGNFAVEIRCRHDIQAGFWTAPFWVTLNNGGSQLMEIDGHEYFPNDPGRTRHATHVRFDGNDFTTYNISPAILSRPHYKTFSTIDEWHTWKLESWVQSGVWTAKWYLDGIQFLTLNSAELAAAGKHMTNAIDAMDDGWNFYICTQGGGAGGNVPEGYTGGADMVVDFCRAWDPLDPYI